MKRLRGLNNRPPSAPKVRQEAPRVRKRFIDLPANKHEKAIDEMLGHMQRVFRLSCAQKYEGEGVEFPDPALRLKKGRWELLEEFEAAHDRLVQYWDTYVTAEQETPKEEESSSEAETPQSALDQLDQD